MIGIDEVGRGAWAGPLLFVAARLKPGHMLPDGLNDSKMLSRKVREQLFPMLQQACEFGEGWVTAKEIDTAGLAQALRIGASRAFVALPHSDDEMVILDGAVNFLADIHKSVTVQVKADMHVPIVSAASVYAKVLRDKYMQSLPEEFDRYWFGHNVGYGTAQHKSALASFGITSEHRVSFAPCAAQVLVASKKVHEL